jgi:pyridoxamine 5'-phosphate oxidase
VSDVGQHDAEPLAELRARFMAAGLDEGDLDPDPFVQFEQWLATAEAAGLHEPTAMVLATASPDGAPAARLVLLKGVADGAFSFFTNYGSAKSADLAANPRAALVFPWHDLGRQVRVTGPVGRTSDVASDGYWASRARGAQVGAWASRQSSVVPTRAAIDSAAEAVAARYRGGDVPRPSFWGGYLVVAETIEFWQGRSDRLHDRLRYRRADGWVIERLAP